MRSLLGAARNAVVFFAYSLLLLLLLLLLRLLLLLLLLPERAKENLHVSQGVLTHPL